MRPTQPSFLRPAKILADLATIWISFALAHYLRLVLLAVIPFGSPIPFPGPLTFFLALCAVWLWLLLRLGAYERVVIDSMKTEAKRLLETVTLGTLIMLAYAFMFRIFVPRSLIVIFAPVNLAIMLGQRATMQWVLSILKWKGYHRESVLIVGAGPLAEGFCRESHEHAEWGLDIIGFLVSDASKAGQWIYGGRVIGTYDDLVEVLSRKAVNQVVVALPIQEAARIKDILAICEEEGIRLLVISDLLQTMVAKAGIDNGYGFPALSFTSMPGKEWQLLCKRLLDVIVSSVLLVLLIPIFLVVAITIKLTSRGPVFYQWRVMGINRRPFKGWKFRTMAANADEMRDALKSKNEMQGPVFKLKDDPRIAPIGRILRRYSVDELPQLWNVLKGDMSLVGPRPPLVTEVSGFKPWQMRKLSVKPGITCLWQVRGRSQITDFDEWVKLDLEYIDHWSLWLDFKILLATIPAVLKGTGV